MHRLSAGFVLAYHGCSRATADLLLAGNRFRVSRNTYDWLGSGIYFWEAHPARGLEFAREALRRNPPSPGASLDNRKPAVVGAVIDLGLCLDLTTKAGLTQARSAYDSMVTLFERSRTPLPVNARKLPLRPLDCAVINYLHELRRMRGDESTQTVRGVFTEGDAAYPGAGFAAKTHIQIAVTDHSCIKGVFRVRQSYLRT